MAKLKELIQKEERLTGGHRLCAGCGASIAVRQVLMGCESDVVVGCATGCLEVATTIYPYTAWKTPFIHNAFENSAATVSGIETAYKVLKKQGKIKKDIKFLAMGGDGGTYDIGLQSLSGALERGHDMVYLCYDNEAYMNTGIQRSGATPFGAATNTAPAGKVRQGKEQFQKDLAKIALAHNIPYVATGAINNFNDLIKKSQKAFEIPGPAFMLVLAPCPRGWRCATDSAVDISKLAVNTNFWPLWEAENGKIKITYKPKERAPIIEWIKAQGRYKHLMKPGNEHLIEKIQKWVDNKFEELLKMEQL